MTPSLLAVAVIEATPSPLATTCPPDTDATDVLLLDQLMVAPDTILPLASLTEVEILALSLMDQNVIVDGLTSTLLICWGILGS